MDSVVQEGDWLWNPGREFIENARLTAFMRWLAEQRDKHFADYNALWRWSVTDLEGFWTAVWDYFGIVADGEPDAVVTGDGMFKAGWFPGVKVNFAEHLLRHEAVAGPEEIALCHSTEIHSLASMTWLELGSQVRRMATRLRELGIGPGDRIVSYMPNVPQTAVAMIAATAIGAVWSSAAPEFGAGMVLDRFSQIAPRLAFVSDGYSFNGKAFDRREEINAIVAGLPTLEHVVRLPFLGLEWEISGPRSHLFDDLLHGPEVPREAFRFERLPSGAPLWVLFSSGTTGLPKAITHSHLGMVLEQLKMMTFHCNLGPGKRMFFYTTTGWMMWNSVVSALITGASAVLYDGSPTFGGIDALWRMAEATGTTCFGASPTLVKNMKAAGISPRAISTFDALDTIILGGAPATPETFQWFYDHVKSDLWVASQSGGTDLCSGLLVGVPTQPVYAAEIQGRALGMAVAVWDEAGEEVVDEEGELVVTRPFPSAPLYFWGDEGDEKYLDAYFSTYPGIWRHGDLAKINSRGGAYVYGRSDSTLNRFGVRIGTAEIYRVLDEIPGIADSLVVCCELSDGDYYMPAFLTLSPGAEFTPVLQHQIVEALRSKASPRHVPDTFEVAPGIPYTLTGKKMEVPVRKLLLGAPPGQAASRDIMARPELLDWYIAFAQRPEIAGRRRAMA